MKEDMITRLHDDVVVQSKYSDGIYQLATGLFLILIALKHIFVYGFVLFFFLFVPVLLLVKYLRKQYTYPRIGYAKLKINDRWGMTWAEFILLVLIMGIILYFSLTSTEVFPTSSDKMVYPTVSVLSTFDKLGYPTVSVFSTSNKLVFPAMSIMFILLFLLLILYKRKRKMNLVWFLSAFIWCAALLLGNTPDSFHFRLSTQTISLIWLVMGLINLVYGIFVLSAFIKKYPVLEEEEL